MHTLLTQPLNGKLQRFHAALRQRGLLHDIAACSWPRPPLRELPAIVDEVRARLTFTLTERASGAPVLDAKTGDVVNGASSLVTRCAPGTSAWAAI